MHSVTAFLTGGAQNPPVMTPGSGSATLTLNDVTGDWSLTGDFNGMNGTSAAAHIHGPAPAGANAGVVTGLTYTLNATSGTLSGSGVFDATQMSNLLAGSFYVNIHTSTNGGGEIRGQLTEVLPIELIKYQAITSNNSAYLTWQTANEVNFSGFEIQKSEANYEWQTMGFVKANGKAGIYNFEDKQLKKLSYYRLRLIDNDGSEKFSSVAAVNVSQKGKQLVLYPNPTKGIVYFNDADFQPTCVKVYSSTGQIMSTESSNCHSNSNEINVSNLPNGLYQIQLTNGVETIQKRIVKQ